MKTIKMIIVWLWVALPLFWGVMKSVEKSLPLFSGESATPPAASR